MAKMRRKSARKTDVIIVGGGHAGLALATCLGAAGIAVVCLERGSGKARQDGRTLALSLRSMKLFREAGVGKDIERDACPILDIRVADQNSNQHLDFHAREVGKEPFGWIVENGYFQAALQKRIKQLKNVEIITAASIATVERDQDCARVILEDGRIFEGDLIAGADGRKSLSRENAGIATHGWDYRQTATVCIIAHDKPHHNNAVEHFLPGGPFATLPMTKQRSSIVWTEKTAAAEELMKMDAEEFTELLQEKVASYLGKIKLLSARHAHPLSLQHAEDYAAERLVLIGDAAHGIHPIAGQGFNLGMGDIGVLVEELTRAAHLGLNLGAAALLKRFEKRRKVDNGTMVLATDLLDRLFSNAIPPVQAARRFGLGAVQQLPPLRRFFMRTAMGN